MSKKSDYERGQEKMASSVPVVLKQPPCDNHRMIMKSSECMWDNKWDERYGKEPNRINYTFVCRSCGWMQFLICKLP